MNKSINNDIECLFAKENYFELAELVAYRIDEFNFISDINISRIFLTYYFIGDLKKAVVISQYILSNFIDVNDELLLVFVELLNSDDDRKILIDYINIKYCEEELSNTGLIFVLYYLYKNTSDPSNAKLLLSKFKFLEEYSDGISVVIPVLDRNDYENKFSIDLVLQSYIGIDCELIVIFNNPKIAQSVLDSNMNIDKYAILSDNFGVSRAWNVGRQLSRKKFIFFINSDVIVKKNLFDQLRNELELDTYSTALVCPSGQIKLNDSEVLLKQGCFDSAEIIDGMHGYCFAINSYLFDKYRINFDLRLSPAFSEEAAINWQIKKNHLKMKAVPTKIGDCQHAESLSHKKSNFIRYDGIDVNKKILIYRNYALVDKYYSI